MCCKCSELYVSCRVIPIIINGEVYINLFFIVSGLVILFATVSAMLCIDHAVSVFACVCMSYALINTVLCAVEGGKAATDSYEACSRTRHCNTQVMKRSAGPGAVQPLAAMWCVVDQPAWQPQLSHSQYETQTKNVELN